MQKTPPQESIRPKFPRRHDGLVQWNDRPRKQISLNFGPWEDRHEPERRREARLAVNQWQRR